MAFGPLGHLNPQLHQITMVAQWADEPLTTAQACQGDGAGVGRTLRQCGVRRDRMGQDRRRTEAAPRQMGFGDPQVHGRGGIHQRERPLQNVESGHHRGLSRGHQYVRKKAKGTISAAKKGDCVQSTVVPAAKK
jgi:hypothetical protein